MDLSIDDLMKQVAEAQALKETNEKLRDEVGRQRGANWQFDFDAMRWNTITLIARVNSALEMYENRFYVDFGSWDCEVTNTALNAEAGLDESDTVYIVGRITDVGAKGDVENRLYVQADRVTIISKGESIKLHQE